MRHSLWEGCACDDCREAFAARLLAVGCFLAAVALGLLFVGVAR